MGVMEKALGLLLGLVAAVLQRGGSARRALARRGQVGCHEEGGEQVQPGSRKVPAGSQAVFRQHSGYVRLKGPKTPGVSFFAYPNGYASCPTPARDRASKTGVSTDLLKETPQRVFAGLYISGVLSRYFGGYMDTPGQKVAKTPGQRDFIAYPFLYPPCIPFRKMDTRWLPPGARWAALLPCTCGVTLSHDIQPDRGAERPACRAAGGCSLSQHSCLPTCSISCP